MSMRDDDQGVYSVREKWIKKSWDVRVRERDDCE